jgi:mRNA interferase MazF
VLTSNIINQRRHTVVVVPLSTSSQRNFPLYVALPSVSERSQAVIDQIRVVDKGRLGDWICTIAAGELNEITEAMKIVFEIR